MKFIRLCGFMLLIVSGIVGCNKKGGDGDTTSDYAATAAGIYTGYYMYSGTSIDGTTQITKESYTTVKLNCNASDTTFGSFTGVTLSDGGNGTIHLNYDRTISLDGTVDKKTLTYIINSASPVSFKGNKPK
jgi:hypothetical protein